MRIGSCTLCKGEARVEALPHGDASEIECARCGKFAITDTVLTFLRAGLAEDEDNRLLPYLSAHTRQETEKGGRVLLTTNWRDVARPHADTPVSEKAIKLLKLIAASSSQPGAPVKINVMLDAPLVDAASVGAFNFLLDYLRRSDHVRHEGGTLYCLTASGWEHLGRLLVDRSTHDGQ